MSRIQIERYSSYPFTTELEVRVSDLNYGAHLGYDSLLGLAHQARIRLLKELGASELDFGDGKTGLIIVDVGVNYRGEAFLGDELVFETCVPEIKGGSFRVAHRVANRHGGDVALIEIGCIAFDYAAHKPGRLPVEFREKLAMFKPVN